MRGDEKGLVRKFRAEMDSQRTDDHIKTKLLLKSTYEMNFVDKSITLTYIGKIDIGDNTKHITNFEMSTNSSQLVMLMQIGDSFLLMFEFGKATQKYLDQIKKLLNEIGIESEIAGELHKVITDSDKQVL